MVKQTARKSTTLPPGAAASAAAAAAANKHARRQLGVKLRDASSSAAPPSSDSIAHWLLHPRVALQSIAGPSNAHINNQQPPAEDPAGRYGVKQYQQRKNSDPRCELSTSAQESTRARAATCGLAASQQPGNQYRENETTGECSSPHVASREDRAAHQAAASERPTRRAPSPERAPPPPPPPPPPPKRMSQLSKRVEAKRRRYNRQLSPPELAEGSRQAGGSGIRRGGGGGIKRLADGERNHRQHRRAQRSFEDERFYSNFSEIIRIKEKPKPSIPMQPFVRLVKELLDNLQDEHGRRLCAGYKFQIGAISCLREVTEDYLVHFYEKCSLITTHAKRVTLMSKDMTLATRLETWNTLAKLSEPTNSANSNSP